MYALLLQLLHENCAWRWPCLTCGALQVMVASWAARTGREQAGLVPCPWMRSLGHARQVRAAAEDPGCMHLVVDCAECFRPLLTPLAKSASLPAHCLLRARMQHLLIQHRPLLLNSQMMLVLPQSAISCS